ncbi:MAG: aldo/keto reductase, partial [Prevotellaceae bacterium]|nr:aldo/keto reductase [Prevotellaceae bacterium]
MKDLTRRNFLKTLGGGVIASSALLSACRNATSDSADSASAEGRQPGEMTYRTSRGTGEKISLLGYGMMRLPVVGGEEGGTARENHDATIDQETVNRLVDYAIEHGVNYYDTSPAYCQGLS